jgi:hypothetical protein
MSGGALAASHYLINSTKQINPKVLKKLRGSRGARGAVGPNGLVGPQGVGGPQGLRGPRGEKGDAGFSALSLLPKGSTESGDFTVSAPAAQKDDVLTDAVTFSIPLTAPIESQVEMTPVAMKTANCLGPGMAARGWLCIYTSVVTTNLKFEGAYNPEATGVKGSGRFGFGTIWKVEASEPAEAIGTWSVTAP